MAQLDAHLTGDMEVVGLINIDCEILCIFNSMVVLSFLLIQVGLLSVTDDKMCTNIGLLRRGLSLPRKCVILR